MYYSSDDKIVLLIQPPAGTADALVESGIYQPYEIDYIYQPNINQIINQIKTKTYHLIILGMAIGGSLETGLGLIDQLLKTSFLFSETRVIIYTYKGLLGDLLVDLQSFIEKKWQKLPANWKFLTKETTYYFEHGDLIKTLKNK